MSIPLVSCEDIVDLVNRYYRESLPTTFNDAYVDVLLAMLRYTCGSFIASKNTACYAISEIFLPEPVSYENRICTFIISRPALNYYMTIEPPVSVGEKIEMLDTVDYDDLFDALRCDDYRQLVNRRIHKNKCPHGDLANCRVCLDGDGRTCTLERSSDSQRRRVFLLLRLALCVAHVQRHIQKAIDLGNNFREARRHDQTFEISRSATTTNSHERRVDGPEKSA